ncbi:hypothetical protein KEM52_001258 [Ascosphaera acerosa]|nr:hypothetical protein KEM52_001258 [Ascosphaera acerosa]
MTDNYAPEGAQALAATHEDARRGALWNYQETRKRTTQYRRSLQNPGWRSAPKGPQAPARSAPATSFDPALFAQQLAALMGQLTDQLSAAVMRTDTPAHRHTSATRSDARRQSAASRRGARPAVAAPQELLAQQGAAGASGQRRPESNLSMPGPGGPVQRQQVTNSDSKHETVKYLDE